MSEFIYVRLEDDGTASACVVDAPDFKRDTARVVASWIREGREVKRLPRPDGLALMREYVERHPAVARIKGERHE